jgi:hypothetical protein
VIFPAIALLSAVVTASATLSGLAALDVSLVWSGQVWRLLTGHLTHLTWGQYAWDAAGFLIVYPVYRRSAGRRGAVGLALFAALAVSGVVAAAGLHQVYGGLSGLNCAAMAALLIGMILEKPRAIVPWMGALAFLLYLLLLQGDASGVAVAREAHWAGTLSGAAYEGARRRWPLFRPQPSP